MEVDSNHRSNLQQIYSLSPLATRESIHVRSAMQTAYSSIIAHRRHSFKDFFIGRKCKIQERLCVLAAECASALQTSSTAHSCNPPEALSQSEIVLSLRRICFTHHLQKWESYLTEIKNPRSQIPLTPGTITRGSTPVTGQNCRGHLF